jgi:hypothetical protein
LLEIKGSTPALTITDNRSVSTWNYGDIVSEIKFTSTDTSAASNTYASIKTLYTNASAGSVPSA